MSYIFKQDLIPSSKYSIKAPYTMTPQYITVHNTSNSASALNEISYMKNNNNATSYHVCIDEQYVIQAVPFNRNAWHAGDGANGTGNRKSIGIEIARSTSADATLFQRAEENAAKYIATLLKQYGWTTSRVKRHKDWSGKNCPHKTMEKGWERFIKMIQKELDILNGKTTTPTTQKPTTSTTTTKPAPFKVGSYNANVKTTDVLNIRSKRNPSSTKIGSIPKGTIIKVGYIMYQDNSVAKKGSLWGSVYTQYGDGFVCMDYVTPTTATPTTTKTTTSTSKTVNYKVKVTVDSLNVRKGAGTGYATSGSVKKGQVFTIVEEKDGWGKLKSGAGWIKLEYTKKL